MNLGDATPRRLLVDWANGQDSWIRQLVAEIVLSRQAPSEAFLDEVYATLLAEKEISGEEVPEIPTLGFAGATEADEETLELVTLTDVQGVNALAADQELAFDPALTVLFGQNGSGKTGYSRILKRVAAVRTAEDILPNARVSELGNSSSPQATISFRLSGSEQTAQWQNEAGLSPFTRISVFDASAVSMHIDSELGYVYTPAELAHFAHVSTGIKGIQRRISVQVETLTPGSNHLLSKFNPGTDVYPLIESLGASTNIEELEELATLPDTATADRERLESEVGLLRSNAKDALLSRARDSVAHLTRLHRVLSASKDFDAQTYETARAALQTAESRSDEAREELFKAEELPGPVDEHWQDFIVVGDNYRQHLNLDTYPGAGDSCLYCRQELSPAALNLLTRYRTFLDETLVRQVKDAEAAQMRSKLALEEVDLTRAIEYAAEQRDSDSAPEWAGQASELLATARATAEATTNGRPIPEEFFQGEPEAVVSSVSETLTLARKVVEELAEGVDNAASSLATKQKQLSELVARIELSRNIDVARDFVRRARESLQLEELSRLISNGVSKQITRQSKLASEDLVNSNFESLFNEECARLRAPKVGLRFQGRSGQAQRKKVVAAYRPSAVLSEGEQKVLALADFLAESRMRGAKAPLVFDDPVTSLDYRRLGEVADRIQNLAETHQVIVLTHNIMFASALIAARQNKKLRTKLYEVRDGGEVKGLLAPDVEPRFDTPADLGKRINVKLQDVPQSEPMVQDALIKESYDLIRAWCEAFVEQELLQNVTQRYRHNIMMTRLSKIDSSRLDVAIEVIEPLFARACERMTGHSHANEHMNIKPTAADVKEDWELALAARAAYIAK